MPHAAFIGPFRILRTLGRGGMGVVFAAIDPGTGQGVALKTVFTPNPGAILGIRREIRALQRLNHPGIVRIVGEGIHEGNPWYAMDLVDGVSLRAHLEGPPLESGDAPATAPADDATTPLTPTHRGFAATERRGESERSAPRRCLSADTLGGILILMERLCSPLAYMHGEGLVHRDLKPENVIVTPSGRPVVVDFGLATSFARSAAREEIQQSGEVSGTLAYMAPEQARGSLVDARADLYALGCMLYEALAGRPPFWGENSMAVLWQHLERAPDPPSRHADGIPDELDALVLRLLEKDPRQRLGYADDVARILGTIAPQPHATAARECEAPRSYLYRPALTGRDEPLRLLGERLHGLAHGRGAYVRIDGESGVGKTRLAIELTARAIELGIQVLLSECVEGTREPLQGLRGALQAIADRCRQGGTGEAERLLGKRGPVLAQYEPSLRAVGPDAAPPPPLSGEAGRVRLFASLNDTLAALAAKQKVLLLIDDAQWADELTLGWLEMLLRSGRLEEIPLCVVLLCRTAEAAELLMGLEPHVAIELPRLASDDVGRIVADMLALPEAPEPLVRYLQRTTEGNPLFVAEYLRSAMERHLLERDAAGIWRVAGASVETMDADLGQLPPPDSLLPLLARRVEGLDPVSGELLRILAVIGREAALPMLAEAASLAEEAILDPLQGLIGRQLVEHVGPTVRFLHDKVREVTYEGIREEERGALHRMVAVSMEEGPGGARDDDMASLGYHWQMAGEPARAKACYVAAARRAATAYAHDEAERLYRAALALPTVPSAESLALRNELGEKVLRARGRMDEAEALHRTALEEARAVGDRRAVGESLRLLGVVMWQTGRLPEASDLYSESLHIARELSDRAGEGRVLGNMAYVHQLQGHMDEALAHFGKALAIAREVGDRGNEGILLGNLGTVHDVQGRLSQARAAYEQALGIAREIGDRRAEALHLGNLAILHYQHGHLEEAREMMEKGLAISREVGDRRSEGSALSNLGVVWQQMGSFAEARGCYEQAVRIHRDVGNRRDMGNALHNLAGLCHRLGRFDEARDLYEQALATHRGSGTRRGIGMVLVDFAEMELLAAQSLERARDRIADCLQALAAFDDRMDRARALCVGGHVALASGASAGDACEEAQRLAAELGAGPESPLGKAVARLVRAMEAASSGKPLLRGVCPQDIAPEQLDWLRRHRPESLPEELRRG